jgi:hypothetical protein
LVKEQPDALLGKLCGRWEGKKGVKVSISTMHTLTTEVTIDYLKSSEKGLIRRSSFD